MLKYVAYWLLFRGVCTGTNLSRATAQDQFDDREKGAGNHMHGLDGYDGNYFNRTRPAIGDNGQMKTPPFVVMANISYVERIPPSSEHALIFNKRQMGGSFFREPLENYLTYYTINLTLGSPLQQVTVLIDTGSSDLWVPSGKYVGGFRHSRSQTWNLVGNDFSIKYVKGYAKGIWGHDTIDFLSGTTLHRQRFGLATDASEPIMGVFGIGPIKSESARQYYSNIPVSLVQHGYIAKNAYSIYLDDQGSKTGSILFGGVDRAKYVPPLRTMRMTSTSSLEVHLDTIEVDGVNYNMDLPVVLDTGTSLMYLPQQIVEQVANAYGAAYDPSRQLYRLSAARAEQTQLPLSVEFALGGATISVPTKELFWPMQWFSGQEENGDYALTMMPNSQSLGFNILGDTFLRSAYIVFDLDAREISLAQTSFSAASDIVPIMDSVAMMNL